MKKLLVTLWGLSVCVPVSVLAQNSVQAETAARVEPFSLVNMMNMVMGLVIVLALILGLAWVLRKYGRLPVTNQVEMKVLGGLSLGTRERAVLVQVEGQKILLGVAPGRVNILQNMSLGVSPDTEERNNFNTSLSQAMEGRQ